MSHEDYSRETEIEGSSNRSFGTVFAIAFMVVGIWPLLTGNGIRIWSILAAAAILGIALAAPHWLTIPNRLWTKLGLMLSRVVSPIVTAIFFYAVLSPYGIAMRFFRKDPLRLKFERDVPTYWISRDPPGPGPKTMKNQF